MTVNEISVSSSEKTARPRWGRILVWGGIILLLVLVFIALLRRQQGPIELGKRVPDFTLATFSGEQINTADLRGKVVLINFWASWCQPCELEADELEAAWRYYQPRGDVVFLGVNWTDTEKKALAYLEKYDITYFNGPDLGTRVSQTFRITGVPETYILDRNGVLAYFKLSPFQSVEEILLAIDPLLEK